jgi:hypothetical protein
MPYQNDMSTMADIIGPAYAAQQAGIQNDASNQEQQIKNQVAAANAPAAGQEAGLKNLFTQAQTAQQQANTQGTTLENIGKAGTLGSSINATNSGNQLKISQDQLQQMTQLGTMANAIAAQMDSIPPPARPAAMQQITQQYGIDPSKLGNMMSGDPAMLRQVSQAMIQGASGYQDQLLKNQGQANVAQIGASSREDVANTRAQAQQYVADQKRQVDQMKVNIDQQIAALTTRIGSSQEQPGDKERLSFLSQQQLQVRQMQAQTTQALLGIGGTPGQAPTTPQLNIGGTSSTPSTQPPAGNALEAEMRRRGLLK